MVTLPTTLYTRTWWRISSPKRMRTKTASYPQESLRTNTMNFNSAHAVRQSCFISQWKYFANTLSGYLKVFQFYRNMFVSCVTCELLCEDLFGTTGANKVFLISSFLWCFVFAGICVFCVFIFLRENLHIQYKATKCTFCGERDSLLLGFNTRSSNSDTLSLQLGSDAKQKPEDETQQSTIPFPGSYILLL